MFNEVKNLLKHSSVYGFANLLQKGIGFIMIPLYTYYLSPTDYGVLELMDLTINVISMLIGMGLGSAIIRFYHHYERPEDKVEVFTTAFIFIGISCLIAVGISELFAKPILPLFPDYIHFYGTSNPSVCTGEFTPGKEAIVNFFGHIHRNLDILSHS
jgi:O-antigen/teichoic acid export membrane protein